MAFTLLFEWFRNTFVCIKSFKVNNLLIQIDDSLFFFRPDGIGTVSMEEKERFEEIKERLSALLENQISHFRYTLYVIQVSAFPIMLYPASPPLYTFLLLLLLLLSLPATIQELPIGPNCYDPGFILWSVSQMVVRFHCFYTWANPAVMSVCSSCISPLHFCLHVCFLSIPALVVFFFSFTTRQGDSHLHDGGILNFSIKE